MLNRDWTHFDSIDNSDTQWNDGSSHIITQDTSGRSSVHEWLGHPTNEGVRLYSNMMGMMKYTKSEMDVNKFIYIEYYTL